IVVLLALIIVTGAAVPRSVIAVSRFTNAKSADDNTGAIGARTPAGFASSCDRSPPWKCTSPPNAIVTAWPLPRRPRAAVVVVGIAVVVGRGRLVLVAAAEAAEAGCDEASSRVETATAAAAAALSEASAATANQRTRVTARIVGAARGLERVDAFVICG
ncbi:MAG: hypothetical protein QOI55_193, partial [Actinomycetota bacterium]|nr:hypothetical protein [Actinomycetota bacterium]